MSEKTIRVSLGLEEFRELVSGRIVLRLSYPDQPVEIFLQDIGFGAMFCAVGEAASPTHKVLSHISKILEVEFDKLERAANEAEGDDVESDGGADRTPPG